MGFLVQHRRGTADQWAEKNTIIPKAGEIVIEIDESNSLHKLKIGDGIHTYGELAYLQAGDEIVTQVLAQALPRVVTVTLDIDKWTKVTCETDPNLGYYGQTITIDNITTRSRLDLQPNADMLAEFQSLNLVFVTENKNGSITVYSVGDKPTKSYTMQATIVETDFEVESEKVVGIPVGTPSSIYINEAISGKMDKFGTVNFHGHITTGDNFRIHNTNDTSSLYFDNIGLGLTSPGVLVLNAGTQVEINDKQIKKVAAPTENTDATNKSYVDNAINGKQDFFALVSGENNDKILTFMGGATIGTSGDISINSGGRTSIGAATGETLNLWGDRIEIHGEIQAFRDIDFPYGNGKITNLVTPDGTDLSQATNVGYLQTQLSNMMYRFGDVTGLGDINIDTGESVLRDVRILLDAPKLILNTQDEENAELCGIATPDGTDPYQATNVSYVATQIQKLRDELVTAGLLS